LLGGNILGRCCDLRGIIELGEFVLPWPVLLHMPLDILYQIAEAFPFVVPCALVMHITERPLNRISPRTIRQQPQQLKFGDQLGPFLYPAQFVEPAAHSLHRYLNTVFGLERRREGSTAPARAAPAIGPWSGFE